MKVVFVDNFDSFTYNLVEYVSEHEGVETAVLKNTASLDDVEAADPDALVISPGPGHPKNARDVGVTAEVLTSLSEDVPTLGVCLGMEAAVHAYGLYLLVEVLPDRLPFGETLLDAAPMLQPGLWAAVLLAVLAGWRIAEAADFGRLRYGLGSKRSHS